MHVIANEGRSELVNNVKVTTQRIRLGSAVKDKDVGEGDKSDSSHKAVNGSYTLSEIKNDSKLVNYSEIYNSQKYHSQLKVIHI
jgi:hypothetical protein